MVVGLTVLTVLIVPLLAFFLLYINTSRAKSIAFANKSLQVNLDQYQHQEFGVEEFYQLKNNDQNSAQTTNSGVYLIHNQNQDKVYIDLSEQVFSSIEKQLNGQGNLKLYQDLQNEKSTFKIEIFFCSPDEAKKLKKYFLKKYPGVGQKYK